MNYIGVLLKGKTRTSQLIEASHLINIVDVLCRLGLIKGELKDDRYIIANREIRIYLDE